MRAWADPNNPSHPLHPDEPQVVDASFRLKRPDRAARAEPGAARAGAYLATPAFNQPQGIARAERHGPWRQIQGGSMAEIRVEPKRGGRRWLLLVILLLVVALLAWYFLAGRGTQPATGLVPGAPVTTTALLLHAAHSAGAGLVA